MSDDSEYGLTGLRDREGELQTVEHSFSFAGQRVTIRFDPPTLAEQEELETLDEDEPVAELERILDRHMVKPSVPDDGSWTAREMWAYIQGIVDWSMGGDGGLGDEIAEEIDDRTPGDEGN